MYWITRKGYKKLYEEYCNIDAEIAKVNLQIGESAKRDADLRENPEFMSLRVKAMYELPAQKRELWNRYENAAIIEESEAYKNFDGNTVIIGSVVTIDFDGDIEEYTILGNAEGDIDTNILSCGAPISEALLGHVVGDSVIFNAMTMKILKVKRYEE